MSSYVPFPISRVVTRKEQTSRTYRLDLESGRIIGKVEGLDAVKQSIMKALITPRFRCLVYSNQFGSEIKQTIIAGDASEAYIRAEIPRQVKDALSPDSRVLGVYDFQIELMDDEAHISFRADTVFGETQIEVVL